MRGDMTLHERDFVKLWTYIYERFGVNLRHKRALIEGRLTPAVEQGGFSGFHAYIEDVLLCGGEKLDAMISRLTTNYTYFMREGAHYDFLRRVVLPEWTGRIRDRDLRVWSAGCSSGEEAYSIAMTIDEYFGLARDGWDTTVLATDISARVIDEAKRGAYQDARLDGLGEARRASHFTRDADGTWRVTERLRHTVVFARFNLMDSFARFKRPFHIIFCRNVMIYFDAETREALARKFRDALEPGGYLFLGMSETLSGARTGFEPVSPAVYRKAGV